MLVSTSTSAPGSSFRVLLRNPHSGSDSDQLMSSSGCKTALVGGVLHTRDAERGGCRCRGKPHLAGPSLPPSPSFPGTVTSSYLLHVRSLSIPYTPPSSLHIHQIQAASLRLVPPATAEPYAGASAPAIHTHVPDSVRRAAVRNGTLSRNGAVERTW